MSKERARKRAEREREQAIRAAARARADERSRRRTSRWQAARAWLPEPRWQPGALARRRRRQLGITFAVLVTLNLLVLFWTSAWEPRALAIMVSLLVAPVLHTMLFRRR